MKEAGSNYSSQEEFFTKKNIPSLDLSLAIPEDKTSLVINDEVFSRLQTAFLLERGTSLEKRIGTADYNEQITSLTTVTAEFLSGERQLPTIQAYIHPRVTINNSLIQEYTKDHLRGVLATTLLSEKERVLQGELTHTGYQNKVTREFNKIILFAGEQGTEHVEEALNQLSDVERAIVFDSMSTSMKAKLNYPDIDECSAEQMSKYLNDAVYGRHGISEDDEGRQKSSYSPEQMMSKLDRLLEATNERDGIDLDASEVIEALLRPPYNQATIHRIIQLSYFNHRLDTLENIFSQSESTALYAKECRLLLNGDREMEVPLWMKDQNRRFRQNNED